MMTRREILATINRANNLRKLKSIYEIGLDYGIAEQPWFNNAVARAELNLNVRVRPYSEHENYIFEHEINPTAGMNALITLTDFIGAGGTQRMIDIFAETYAANRKKYGLA